MSPSRTDALLRELPPAEAAAVLAVVAEAERRSLRLYLVGGPVRDWLLGRPLRDADLLVEARGEFGAEALARAAAPEGARVVPHGRFGTVRIETGDGAVDLATVRSEVYARPGALPTVAPGTLEDDLERRDFTVNALAVPLTQAARQDRPAVIDPGQARHDLESRVLRVFHRRSFHDDPSRALRAARLAARLGFRLSRGSRTALRDALRDGAVGAVSGDRLRREIEKLFEEPLLGGDPARALRFLGEWHVLGAMEPGLSLPAAAAPVVRRLGRVLADPPWAPARRLRPWAAGLAVWLAALDATQRRRTLRRLAVRGELSENLRSFPRDRDRWLRAIGKARGRGALDAVLGSIDDERLLALFVSAGVPVRKRIQRWALEDRGRRLPVSGSDLTALGLSGPVVGTALAQIRRGVLDGQVESREEALAVAHEVAARAAKTPAPRRRARRS